MHFDNDDTPVNSVKKTFGKSPGNRNPSSIYYVLTGRRNR